MSLFTYELEFRYFALATGVEVKWMAHPKTIVFHAKYVDHLNIALCGVKAEFTDIRDHYGAGLSDPSNDIMTCENCAGLVRRVKRGD